jgi:UDP-N-acetyl-D-glucosamine dehydrogenase
LAYKKNIDDVRESPAFAIWELLEARGALVSYHDPHVPEVPRTREHGRLAGRRSAPLSSEALAGLDAAVVVTDHDAVDYGGLAAAVGLVVDTRNVMGRFQAGPGCEIVAA